jgi:hypothetical protein
MAVVGQPPYGAWNGLAAAPQLRLIEAFAAKAYVMWPTGVGVNAPTKPVFDFPTHGAAFLWRANAALEAFDATERGADLITAAMHLRLGIEARLFEYIDVALRQLGQPRSKISKYQAQVLLARLTSLAPDAQREGGITVTIDRTGESATSVYTPVTKELAGVHSRLGTFLHYPYFWNEEMWYLRRRFEDGRGWPTLYHVRDFVADGISQLNRACSGTLLAHPVFTVAVEHLLADDGAT